MLAASQSSTPISPSGFSAITCRTGMTAVDSLDPHQPVADRAQRRRDDFGDAPRLSVLDDEPRLVERPREGSRTARYGLSPCRRPIKKSGSRPGPTLKTSPHFHAKYEIDGGAYRPGASAKSSAKARPGLSAAKRGARLYWPAHNDLVVSAKSRLEDKYAREIRLCVHSGRGLCVRRSRARSPARADGGGIAFEVFKAGFVVGGSGGSGRCSSTADAIRSPSAASATASLSAPRARAFAAR